MNTHRSARRKRTAWTNGAGMEGLRLQPAPCEATAGAGAGAPSAGMLLATEADKHGAITLMSSPIR